jgi:mono/diheme cytochrome c family protein
VTSSVITVLAVVAGIIWLGVLLVSALRNRGGAEEVAANLKPGIDDQQLETRRLEKGQKAAIAFSAFLAISLPLYFLGETNRQEGFVEDFSAEQVARGAAIVESFKCFSCHGPLGSGGSASFVEKRSGVTVAWTAPSLDDVLYRYQPDEVTHWITYGRANTPMPAWGVAGGGPMNTQQIQAIVAYLTTIQVSQQEAVDKTPAAIESQISRLDNADATVAQAVINQEQVVAEIDQAPEDRDFIDPVAERAQELLDTADQGIDTDGDGLSDTSEIELSQISHDAVDYFREVDPIVLDPETPDAELVDEGLQQIEADIPRDPILQTSRDAIELALEEDVISADSPDTDGDGISDAGEARITGLFAEAADATVPSAVTAIDLDPTNPETVTGQPDLDTATTMVGGLDTESINVGVTVENEDRIRPQQEGGLEFLRNAQQQKLWEVDLAGVAESMDATEEEAQRAVALFDANCARCHTSGFSAGVPYTQEAGSGGFAPALWKGREVIQFGEPPANPEETDLLIDFLTKGSQADTPYGINGDGTGRMPAFGEILDPNDIALLARYLRGGNLDGSQ